MKLLALTLTLMAVFSVVDIINNSYFGLPPQNSAEIIFVG